VNGLKGGHALSRSGEVKKMGKTCRLGKPERLTSTRKGQPLVNKLILP